MNDETKERYRKEFQIEIVHDAGDGDPSPTTSDVATALEESLKGFDLHEIIVREI